MQSISFNGKGVKPLSVTKTYPDGTVITKETPVKVASLNTPLTVTSGGQNAEVTLMKFTKDFLDAKKGDVFLDLKLPEGNAFVDNKVKIWHFAEGEKGFKALAMATFQKAKQVQDLTFQKAKEIVENILAKQK